MHPADEQFLTEYQFCQKGRKDTRMVNEKWRNCRNGRFWELWIM